MRDVAEGLTGWAWASTPKRSHNTGLMPAYYPVRVTTISRTLVSVVVGDHRTLLDAIAALTKENRE